MNPGGTNDLKIVVKFSKRLGEKIEDLIVFILDIAETNLEEFV